MPECGMLLGPWGMLECNILAWGWNHSLPPRKDRYATGLMKKMFAKPHNR